MPSYRRFGSITVVLALMAIACVGESGTTSTTATPSTMTIGSSSTTATSATPSSTPPLAGPTGGTLSAWNGQQATLTVPLDHGHPDGPTIDVPIWRAEALDPARRVGVLLVNPGGPGAPAWPLVANAPDFFTEELRSHFDIVSIDPRGTFPDTAVDCFGDIAGYCASVDWSPDAPGELEAADAAVQGAVDACAAEYGHLLPHLSTMDTVHDMAALVAALGEEQISFLGTSYGTVLGAALVSTYPELVRAAALDAGYHPFSDPFIALLEASQASDKLLASLFAECDADPDCPIQGGTKAAFVRVAAAADAEPLTANRFLPTVNEQGFAFLIGNSAAAHGGSADRLFAAVADADSGDAFLLQDLLEESAATFNNSLFPIRCMDHPYRGVTPYPENAAAIVDESAPNMAAVFPIPEGFDPYAFPGECERWPFGPDPLPSPFSSDGSGPILVVTATNDTVSPAAGAERLAAELGNSTLLRVESAVHGSYQGKTIGRTAARACATEIMDNFLINLEAPGVGTVCR